jgi:hypothetical protein
MWKWKKNFGGSVMKRIFTSMILALCLLFLACFLPSSGFGDFLDSADYITVTFFAGTYWIWLYRDKSAEAIAYLESEGYVCTSGPERTVRDEKDHRTEVVEYNEVNWGVLYYKGYNQDKWLFKKEKVDDAL